MKIEQNLCGKCIFDSMYYSQFKIEEKETEEKYCVISTLPKQHLQAFKKRKSSYIFFISAWNSKIWLYLQNKGIIKIYIYMWIDLCIVLPMILQDTIHDLKSRQVETDQSKAETPSMETFDFKTKFAESKAYAKVLFSFNYLFNVI